MNAIMMANFHTGTGHWTGKPSSPRQYGILSTVSQATEQRAQS
jgi:hypothetical protein